MTSAASPEGPRPSSIAPDPGVEVVAGDVQDPSSLDRALAGSVCPLRPSSRRDQAEPGEVLLSDVMLARVRAIAQVGTPAGPGSRAPRFP
jgi:hypothetical protein